MKDLAKKIKEIRTKGHLSQEEFAKSLGYSKAYIANIETGRTKPSRRFLEAIVGRYDISLDWLISRNRLLFLLDSGIREIFFIYAFTQEDIDNCEKRLTQLLKYENCIFIDALGIKSMNRLLSRILNQSGTTEKLWQGLRYNLLTKQTVLIIKNMSLSRIQDSDGWVWSIYNIIKDAPVRAAKINNSEKSIIFYQLAP